MISAILTIAVALGIGHIDGTLHANLVRTSNLEVALAPRTEAVLLSSAAAGGCMWLDRPRVSIGTQASVPARWAQDHSVEMFAGVAFNGIGFVNYSRRWVVVRAHVFNGCVFDG